MLRSDHKLIVTDKNKLIEELKSDKSKLEKKVEDSIKEKDQLKREKDDLVDRFKRKEDYWSSLYMKMFTAAETNHGLAALFRTEGAQMRSQLTSVAPSPDQSISCSQDGSAFPQVQTDNEDQQMQINTNEEEKEQEMQIDTRLKQQQHDDYQENKESDIVCVCHLCGEKVTGPALKWEGIEITGALMVHLNTACFYVHKYTDKVNEAAAQWEKYLEGEKLKPCRDIRSFFSSCNEFLTVIASKVENIPKTKGRLRNAKDDDDTVDQKGNELDQFISDISVLNSELYSGVSAFQDIMQPLFQFRTIYSTTKAERLNQQDGYYLLNPILELTASGRRSYLIKSDDTPWENQVKVQQQQKLADLTRYWCSPCQRIFSCRDLWIKHCAPGCNYSDVFFDLKYDHSFGSGLFSLSDASVSNNGLTKRKMSKTEIQIVKEEIKLLNSQYKASKAREVKLAAEEKRTPLEQRRVDQEIIMKDLFKTKKVELLAVEDWLASLAHRFKRSTPFTKIGSPICDAIILPKCPLIFGVKDHHLKMQSHFLQFQVPVATIADARKKGFIFLGLDDAKNQFTTELVQRLKAAINDLIAKVKAAGGNEKGVFICQIDYTQDILGFFLSPKLTLPVNDPERLSDLKNFAEALGIPYSRTLDQLASCFQFTSLTLNGEEQVPSNRVKVYNKWVHLLTSGQKKWISMDLKKLLEPTLSFYLDKVTPTKEFGFSRIEVSNYFYSQDEWLKSCRSITPYEKYINKTLEVLNQMPQLNYSLSWNDCVNSYMKMVDTKQPLIAFENDLIGIAYSYCRRSCRFAGHIVNVTSKSSSFSDFLKQYGRETNRIFINGKQFLVKKDSPLMQIPISSFNEQHRLRHNTNLDPTLFHDNLDREQLDKIKLTCTDPEFYQIFGGGPDSGVEENYPMEYDNERSVSEIEAINTNVSQQLSQSGQTVSRNRSRSRNQDNEEQKQPLPRQNRRQISSHQRSTSQQWIKKGFSLGKQRWQCLYCKVKTSTKDDHRCDNC